MSNQLGMSLQLEHHRFLLDEYEAMIEKGILDDDDRVELLAGEIVDKMGQGPRHASSLARLNRFFVTALGTRALLVPQGPLALPPHSMPEPDITLVREREDFYATRRPLASDVYLVIEISDSSLRLDRRVKLPLYARAGIAEYWIVNLVDCVIEVYTEPAGDRYEHVRTVRPDEVLSPIAFPDVTASAGEIIA
ncbi:MAG: Uma2 family endonuclease [Candidatus Tyrphobacter sp.]